MKSVLLMGPPGSGKTTMMCETAMRRPVLVNDLDRKLLSMQRLQPFIDSGDVICWEIDAPVTSDDLEQRVERLADNKKPAALPQGWIKFAKYAKRLETDEAAMKAGTWGFDSLTTLGEHLKALILYHDDKGTSTFSDRNYGSFLQMWSETMTRIIDSAKKLDKDVIFTVHERPSEIPIEGTKVVKSKDEKGAMRKEYLGPMDVKIAGSVEGQFGIKMGKYFDEVYALRVEPQGRGVPRWICRVMPDGVRDLRTSYRVSQAEFEPDFRKIWR